MPSIITRNVRQVKAIERSTRKEITHIDRPSKVANMDFESHCHLDIARLGYVYSHSEENPEFPPQQIWLVVPLPPQPPKPPVSRPPSFFLTRLLEKVILLTTRSLLRLVEKNVSETNLQSLATTSLVEEVELVATPESQELMITEERSLAIELISEIEIFPKKVERRYLGYDKILLRYHIEMDLFKSGWVCVDRLFKDDNETWLIGLSYDGEDG